MKWLCLLVLTAGCSATVGDKCTINSNCGTSLTCAVTGNDRGYCTRTPCRVGECPAEAACIDFGTERSLCMRTCDADNECPSGLKCSAPIAVCPPEGTTNTQGQGCSRDPLGAGKTELQFCEFE